MRATRRIEQHAISHETLLADDFDAFFERRGEALLSRIGHAMGKPIADTTPRSRAEDYVLDEEEPSDEDAAEVVA